MSGKKHPEKHSTVERPRNSETANLALCKANIIGLPATLELKKSCFMTIKFYFYISILYDLE